jgi:asparagine synthetase B (glutamine-hydrolysing)
MTLPMLLRRRLMANIPKGEQRVAVALSGGVDSCSVLAACLRAGLDPIVISYTPDTHLSTDYRYARKTAEAHDLRWQGVGVSMSPENLLEDARMVIGMGYRTKMQVESLVPMITIAREAQHVGATVLLTGDQADGYYINGNWMSRNYDRSQGIPGPERQHVRLDKDSQRIDVLRRMYWDQDRGNCGAVQRIAAEFGVKAVMPYRDPKILRLFLGLHWSEVNEPRLKEPAWRAFPELGVGISVRDKPVNLHRGDSYFAETFGKTMLEMFPQYKTPLGVYGGIARGEI